MPYKERVEEAKSFFRQAAIKKEKLKEIKVELKRKEEEFKRETPCSKEDKEESPVATRQDSPARSSVSRKGKGKPPVATRQDSPARSSVSRKGKESE